MSSHNHEDNGTVAIINGLALNYGDTGSGTPILLIHGYPLSRHMWRCQTDALVAAGYRVITPDLRGFGRSDAPAGPYGMETFADDAVALLDHLEIDRAVVGGMSMGGYVLLNLLERYPARVSAACFLMTRATADDEAGKARRLALSQEVQRFGPQVIVNMFRQMLFAPDTLEANQLLVDEICQIMADTPTAGLAGALLAMRERKDYTPLLGTFRLPALIMGGDQDQAVPLEQLRIIEAGLPNSTIRIIPGGGHLVNLEQPDRFNSALLEFLQSLS